MHSESLNESELEQVSTKKLEIPGKVWLLNWSWKKFSHHNLWTGVKYLLNLAKLGKSSDASGSGAIVEGIPCG